MPIIDAWMSADRISVMAMELFYLAITFTLTRYPELLHPPPQKKRREVSYIEHPQTCQLVTVIGTTCQEREKKPKTKKKRKMNEIKKMEEEGIALPPTTETAEEDSTGIRYPFIPKPIRLKPNEGHKIPPFETKAPTTATKQQQPQQQLRQRQRQQPQHPQTPLVPLLPQPAFLPTTAALMNPLNQMFYALYQPFLFSSVPFTPLPPTTPSPTTTGSTEPATSAVKVTTEQQHQQKQVKPSTATTKTTKQKKNNKTKQKERNKTKQYQKRKQTQTTIPYSNLLVGQISTRSRI